MQGSRAPRRRMLCLALCAWAGSSSGSPASAPAMPGPHATVLHLGANQRAITQLVGFMLLRDICARADCRIEVEPLPGRRATLMARSGALDGEVARVSSYAASNPPLLRVDPPYYGLTTGVFVRKGFDASIASIDDLTDHHVGVVTGEVHAELAARRARAATEVGSYDQLFKLLDAGRIDVAIDTAVSGDAEIHRLGLGARLAHLSDIGQSDLHAILTPRHAALAAQLGDVIRAMRATGELKALTRDYEREAIELWAVRTEAQ